LIYRGWIIKTALSEEKKTLLNGRKNTRKKNIHTIKEIDRRGGYRHK